MTDEHCAYDDPRPTDTVLQTANGVVILRVGASPIPGGGDTDE